MNSLLFNLEVSSTHSFVEEVESVGPDDADGLVFDTTGWGDDSATLLASGGGCAVSDDGVVSEVVAGSTDV